MKKFTAFLVAALLVLSISSGAFAKGNINLGVGYTYFNYSGGVSIDISGGYRFNNWFSLEGDLLLAFGKNVYRVHNENEKSFAIDTDILAKFDLYKYGYLSLGLQVGIKNSFFKYDTSDPLSTSPKIITLTRNIFSIGSGFFFDLYFAPKTKFYLNMFIPVLLVETDNIGTYTYYCSGVDIKFGVNYEINSNFNLGIESVSILTQEGNVASLGAKIGYKF